jgi:hypothetical protein
MGKTTMSKQVMYTAAILTTLTLTGCDSNKQVVKIDTSVVKQDIPLKVELIPRGHWLFNPMHCKEQLPSVGVYDLKVDNNDMTYIGITQSGRWLTFENENAKAEIDALLDSDAFNCFKPEREYDVVMATYKAIGTNMVFAIIPGHPVLFRYQHGKYEPAAPFNKDVLKGFTFIETQQDDPYVEQN